MAGSRWATKLDPPRIVLSMNLGRRPRYSTTGMAHIVAEELLVRMPSIAVVVRPATRTARMAACASNSISVSPWASPRPAVPTPAIATLSRMDSSIGGLRRVKHDNAFTVFLRNARLNRLPNAQVCGLHAHDAAHHPNVFFQIDQRHVVVAAGFGL